MASRALVPKIFTHIRFALPYFAVALSTTAQPGYFKIQTVAGSASIGDGGMATLAQIGNMQGVAVDHSGNVYLSDTDRNLVRKVDNRGIISTLGGSGVAGFSGDGGPAASAQLNLPYGLAADLAGNIYVADLGNNRVRRINSDGSIVTVAGTGVKGSLGDGGQAANAQLMSPRNVAVDAAGSLYISEFEGHRVRKVAPDGTISTVAGSGIAGFRGDGGQAASAQIGYPAGVAVDRSGALYIADTQNSRIRKVLANGLITTVLGGSGATALITPIGVAVDSAGAIYVVDSTLVVRSYSPQGIWAAVAGTGSQGFSGDGGPAAKALLSRPRDVAVDYYGEPIIADGARVREVDFSGNIRTIAGDGYLHAVGDGGPALNGILNQPSAVALDRFGNLFIADPGTQRIRQVLPTGTIQTFAGTGSPGFNGDQIPAPTAQLNSPLGVAVDAYGEVFLADTSNQRLREAGANGRIATYAGTGVAGTGAESLPPTQTQLRNPAGVCISSTGTVYLADTANHRVLHIGPATVETAAGNGSPGLAGDGGAARAAQLNNPVACTTDSAGNLFIADTFNARIAKVNTAGIISTVAGSGSAGFGGDTGLATAAQLAVPRGVAVDDNGDVFIADTANNRIRQVTPNGNIFTIAGTGATGFSGDGGPALNAQLNSPGGIFLDGSGNLYFADTGNNRIRVLSPTTPPVQLVVPPPAPPSIDVDNAASLQPGAVAPGELVTIYGTSIGPQSGMPGVIDGAGLYANLLGGAEVRFDGVPAPIFYTQSGQINTQVPFAVASQSTTHVEVRYQNQIVGAADVPVTDAAPAVYPTILNQDGTFNSADNPAYAGTLLTFFGTGAGVSQGGGDVAGSVSQAPYSQPQQPVAALVAGQNASILYAGSAPGEVGVLQVNLQIPQGIASGQVALQLSVGNAVAPPVMVWIE